MVDRRKTEAKSSLIGDDLASFISQSKAGQLRLGRNQVFSYPQRYGGEGLMTVKIIACEVMKEELLGIIPKDHVEYEFIPMKLHLYPHKLHKELQDILDGSLGYSKIIMAFGLCGGAIKNLKATDSPLIIPRVHDCLPLLLGSKTAYQELAKEEIGTFYLSCGWMISEKNILSSHQRVLEKYGEKKALRVLERTYDSYKKVLFIHTGCAEEEPAIQQAKEIATLLKLRYDTVQGNKSYLEKIVNGPWEEDDFAHIPPFEAIEEELFGIGI